MSTRISLYEHPLSADPPQVFIADNLAQWLLEHYGDHPQVSIQIYTGQPSADTDITGNVTAILACSCDDYVILQCPGLPTLPWYVWAAITAVATVVAVLLIPKPEMPGNINRTQSSPNNSLGQRENKVRLLERVEDIYGTVKSIPSLMMPTYNKYIGNIMWEYGYYCIGRGYFDMTTISDSICDGDTLIADISGASAAVYNPFTSPNSGGSPALQIGSPITDPIITARRIIAVDGITLLAPNQVTLPTSDTYTLEWDVVGGKITQTLKTPNFNAIADVGDAVTVTMSPYTHPSVGPDALTVTASSNTFTYTGSGTSVLTDLEPGSVFTTSGFINPGNNGTFTVATKTGDTIITTTTGSLVDEACLTASIAFATVDYSGTGYTVAAVLDGALIVSGAAMSTRATLVCGVQMPGIIGWTNWVTVPELDRTQIWCNVIAPNGMYVDSGGGKSRTTVVFTIEIEKLTSTYPYVPLGTPVVETVTDLLSGAVTDLCAVTIEHATVWAGPCRVRMRRTTDFDFAFSGTVIDEIKWADLYSIAPVTKTQFGNKTTIHTITQATARATAVKTRQINCLASRLIPTFDGTSFSATLDATGLLTSGTLHASSKLVDVIAAVAVDPKIGKRDLATEVDMAQIWSVQGLLDAWSTECGQVNYTFDTDNLSFEETLILIVNAGFCIAYRQNGKIRLAFDHAQTTSTALFTHRNKKPKAETITRSFSSDADYDGVSFVYQDPVSQQGETITLSMDSGGTPSATGNGTKFKKFEIAGIRSWAQAWYRANRELYKLLNQRILIETTTTLDARALLPNERIDIVDNTRFKSYDGEIVGQSGLELTLSQAVAFIPATSHSIVLMKRDGSLQSITCTAGSASNKVVLASAPAEAIVTSFGPDGIRTIYSFAADSARDAMGYLVQEVDLSDGHYAVVKAINYSANYYTADTTAVPNDTAKAAIIY